MRKDNSIPLFFQRLRAAFDSPQKIYNNMPDVLGHSGRIDHSIRFYPTDHEGISNQEAGGPFLSAEHPDRLGYGHVDCLWDCHQQHCSHCHKHPGRGVESGLDPELLIFLEKIGTATISQKLYKRICPEQNQHDPVLKMRYRCCPRGFH